jgi:NAD(P) transhydrogenase subunit beta
VDKSQWINLGYLLSAVLFIFGLRGLTHPRTAVRGNWTGALGMLVAVVVTLWHQEVTDPLFIWIGLGVGSVIGLVLAVRIQMTAMPQMVALLNGFGGAASYLVAGAELMRSPGSPADATVAAAEGAAPAAATLAAAGTAGSLSVDQLVAAAASGLIGAVTLTGSLVAFSKLQELWFRKPVHLPGHQAFNALLAALCVALFAWVVASGGGAVPYWGLVVVASVLGVTLAIPIGGADMPVVIALLNSYSGLAAAATGFVLQNTVLIVSGSLVGASGIILTNIMCRAMNRSLPNVLFGTLGPTADTATADEVYAGRVKATSAEEVAMLLETARRVVIVPGYGLAVAQAQHTVRDLADELQQRGVEVEYAIHPVAGRMPGHMNVLLAEADVPYDQLKDLDAINPSFPQTDVVLVIGANDVVNPLARTDPRSPIAGMPILDVDKARTVVVIKRSLSPGFAGIPNPLFAADNCLMLFADGKQALLDLVSAVKELG